MWLPAVSASGVEESGSLNLFSLGKGDASILGSRDSEPERQPRALSACHFPLKNHIFMSVHESETHG